MAFHASRAYGGMPRDGFWSPIAAIVALAARFRCAGTIANIRRSLLKRFSWREAPIAMGEFAR